MIGGALAVAAAGAVSHTEDARAGVDDDVNEVVGKQNKIYFDNQPLHVYDYSAPRDVMLQLYDALTPHMPDTWTVFYVAGVGAVDVTPSKGYPIPFGVQLTSPQYPKMHGSDGIAPMPQPEPTGLYTDGVQTSASWVLAVNEQGYVIPEYHEEMCVCYPFEVQIDPATRGIKRVGQASASVAIDLSRAS